MLNVYYTNSFLDDAQELTIRTAKLTLHIVERGDEILIYSIDSALHVEHMNPLAILITEDKDYLPTLLYQWKHDDRR